MVKKRRLIPIWYIIFVAVLYLFPIVASVAEIVSYTIDDGVIIAILRAICVLIISPFVGYLPYFLSYYGAAMLLHAIIDETLIFKKTPWWSKLAILGGTLVISAIMVCGAIWRLQFPDPWELTTSEFPWPAFLMMLIGTLLNEWALIVRIVFGIAYPKLAHKRARLSQPATEYEPIDIDLREM